jgi:hypothetical protein
MVGTYGNDKMVHECLLVFWYQLQKGAEICYTLTEKQIKVVHAALIAIKPLTGKQKVKIWTKYPIVRWV